jgi:hypothetical protein
MSVEKPEGHGIIGEKLGAWIADGQAPALPAQTVEIARLLLLDVTGLCISAGYRPGWCLHGARPRG